MMRKILNISERAWEIANSNVGSAIIGATAGYVLTKSYREQEILELKNTVEELKKDQEIASKTIHTSSDINKRIHFQLTERNHELQNCRMQRNAIMHDYASSICIWKKNSKIKTLDKDATSVETQNNKTSLNP
jgi:hypothetical protein